jgi:hypothetical protein
MNKEHDNLAFGAFVLFQIILLIKFADSIILRNWTMLALSVLAIVCLIFPLIITRIAYRKKITLPSRFQFIMVIFIFLTQYLGEIKKFYIRYWWWDLLLHAVFGSYMVVTAVFLTEGIIIKEQGITDKRFALFCSVFAFCFSVALGTLWEIFEFSGDYLFKSQMVKGGLEDTATDLMVKALAALITSVIFYFRKAR